jgi:hypothetical protein
MDPSLIEYLVGTLFVALYAFERINTPKIDMAATTPMRYWSMALAYIACSLLLYFVLAHTLSLVGIKTLTSFGVKLPESIDETSPPILMALILTVMLSRVPGIAKLDEMVRSEFRHRALMSRIAGNLSYLLERSPMQLSAAQQDAIVTILRDQGIKEKDIVFVDNGTPQYLWTRICVLMVRLRHWASEPGYRDFIHAFRHEWEILLEDTEKCEAKAIRCFRLCEVAGDDEELSSALRDCRQHYARQLDGLLKQLSNFMGRGIACVSGNHPEQRRRALVEMGFDVHFDVGYTVHQIAFVIMVAFAVSILLPALINLMGYQATVLWPYVLKIVTGYAIAAMVALHMHYRRSQLVTGTAERPWGLYLAAGVITVLFTILFSLLSDVLFRGIDPMAAITRFSQAGYAYHLRPLVMAIMLSYMLDTRLAMQGLRSLQWRETGISAVLMASTSWGIILLLEYSKTRYPMVHVPNALTMVLTATVIGAVIAFWLPTSTRRVAERAPERDEVARATPGTTDIHPTAT